MKLPHYSAALIAALLCACDNPAPPAAPGAPQSEAGADNPLLKLQNDTVEKTQNAVNQAVEKQQNQLENL